VRSKFALAAALVIAVGSVLTSAATSAEPARANTALVALASVSTARATSTSQAGSIVPWGSNSRGVLNAPSGTDRVAIAAGYFHGLALNADGSLVGWGDNTDGQATPPSGNDNVAIAGGGWHSLALKSDGSLVGWGHDTYGQSSPPAGNDYVSIAAGYYHSLAIKSDGSIIGWGDDTYGQATPPAGNDFVAIAAGYWHSLALKADGTIVGWGANYAGQTTTPVGNTFVSIATGNQHALALRADGSIVGWGANDRGGQATPPPGNDYVAIAAGGHHSLVLKSDGSIVGWGESNAFIAPTGIGYIAIASGGSHSIALSPDTTPPTDPTLGSLSHTLDLWSRYRNIDIIWSGAVDSYSGIDGFSYSWDHAPSTVPDMTMERQETVTDAFNSLADGSWYFHLRTRDNAGNWSGGVHLGPFLIDGTRPGNPGVTSPSHQAGIPSSDNTVDITWSSANDTGGSGLDGYSYAWTRTSNSIPDETKELEEDGLNIWTSPALIDQQWWYFHIWARDNAGNWGSVVNVGPFIADTIAPTATIDTGPTDGSSIDTNEPSFGFSSNEPGSGFECKTDAGSYESCLSPKSLGPLVEGAHSFSVRSIDQAGNTGAAVVRSFIVDTVDTVPNTHQPDAKIRKSAETVFAGNNIYNTDGVGQTTTAKARVGQSRTFVLRFQNDGNVASIFTILGPASSGNFRLRFLKGATGSTDITAQVVAGTYATSSVRAGDRRTIRLVVTVKRSAPIGVTLNASVVATSLADAAKKDAAKAVVKVK
jgi:hypothetical protein